MVTAPMREDEEAGRPLQMSTGSLLATGQVGCGDTGPSGVTLLPGPILQAERSEQRQTAPREAGGPGRFLSNLKALLKRQRVEASSECTHSLGLGRSGLDRSSRARWSAAIFLPLIRGALCLQNTRQAWHFLFDLIKPG